MNIFKHISVFSMAMVAAISVSATTITGEDVVKMHRAGVSDDVVIQTIESSGSMFYLSQQDTEALKREGVSERVIAVMQKKRGTPPPAQSPAPTNAGQAIAVPFPPQAVAPTNGEKTVADPAPPAEQATVRAQEVVRAIPVYPAPVTTYYYYPPPPVPYYYGARYYYDPWYPPVSFSFGFYGGHGGHGCYRGGHGHH